MSDAFNMGPDSVRVTWLPQFHEMGLMESQLMHMFNGCPGHLMASAEFIQVSQLWMEAISRYRGTYAVAPNLACDHCARIFTEAQKDSLDLVCLVKAYTGAETIREEAMDLIIIRGKNSPEH
jgi:acyl-CoA synthetase (AMP-forming)/AMP-acid ligase II